MSRDCFVISLSEKRIAAEMGEGRYYPKMSARIAQLEITLPDINSSVPADLF